MTFPLYTRDLPYLSTSEMVEVDRAMIEDYQIELIQMMENAGRNLAHLARVRFLEGSPLGRSVAVLAGTGGNGGGALVCARRLSNWGAAVTVITAKADDQFAGVPGHQLQVLRNMTVDVVPAGDASGMDGTGTDLIVDGLIGYGLSGAPSGSVADLIRWAIDAQRPVLALDIPSGLDATSGEAYEPAIRAAATMTLALPKRGLRAAGAEAHVGELYLADIGVPPALYAAPPLELEVGDVFTESDIVRLP